MNTLRISHILNHLQHYQAQYLNILNCADQYYIPVEDAYINLWPIGRIDLCLGDLLQLWFSQKWSLQQYAGFFEFQIDQKSIENNSYLFQIKGNLFKAENQCIAFSLQDQQTITLTSQYGLKFWAEYKALSRPVKIATNTGTRIKFAI